MRQNKSILKLLFSRLLSEWQHRKGHIEPRPKVWSVRKRALAVYTQKGFGINFRATVNLLKGTDSCSVIIGTLNALQMFMCASFTLSWWCLLWGDGNHKRLGRGLKEKASQGNALKAYIGALIPHPSSHQDLSSVFCCSVCHIYWLTGVLMASESSIIDGNLWSSGQNKSFFLQITFASIFYDMIQKYLNQVSMFARRC